MPTDTEPKMRKAQNLSPEERERRRQRMIELRKRLQEEKDIKAKPVRPTKPRKPSKAKPEPISEQSDSQETSDDSEVEELSRQTRGRDPVPVRKQKVVAKPKPSKPIAIPNKHSNVVKKVSIKYYGHVSDEQMAKDRELLSNGFASENTNIQQTKPKRKPPTKRIEQPKKEQEKTIEEQPQIATTAPPEPKPTPTPSEDKNALFMKILGY